MRVEDFGRAVRGMAAGSCCSLLAFAMLDFPCVSADAPAESVKPLDTTAVQSLVEGGASRLTLPNLKTVTPEIADILSTFQGDLTLGGITTLDEAAAGRLAGHTCESWYSSLKGNVPYPALVMDGIKELDDAAADAIAEHPGRIQMEGLRKLSSLSLATKLASHRPETADTKPKVPENANFFRNPELMDALSYHSRQVLLDKLFFRPGNPLRLDRLKSLSGPIAGELSRHRGFLSLDGLESLPDDVAVALGRHSGGLSLDGLTTLSDAAVEELSASDGMLSLCGIESFSDEQMRHLSEHEGDLRLDGVRRLSDAQAAMLSQHEGGISLGGLTEASTGVVASILKKRTTPGSWIRLDGLRSLPDDLAEALGRCECSLSFGGLKTISPALAASVAGTPGAIRLAGVIRLSPEAAMAFGGKTKEIMLDGLREMPVDLADALGDHRGPLSLDGLKSLSRDAAMSLSNHDGPLSLGGIEALDDDLALVLFRSETPIALAGLKKMTKAGARALAGHLDAVSATYNLWRREAAIELMTSPRLEGQPIAALAAQQEAKGSRLSDQSAYRRFTREMNAAECPDGPTVLTPELAALLAAYDGPLILDHLTSLDTETARQLAKHRGMLSLRGLRVIGSATAAALSEHRGTLDLAGLYTLGERAALALCRHKDLGGKPRTRLSREDDGRHEDDCDLLVPGLVYVVTERAANAIEKKTGLGFLEAAFEPLPTGEPRPGVFGLP